MRTSASVPVIQSSVDKTERWLTEIANYLDWDNNRQSWKALRVVLHTLRDRLTTEEASDLASQLPMVIRGMFYEGWNPSKPRTRIRKIEEFTAIVNKEFSRTDLQGFHESEDITRAVLQVIANHVSEGEVKDIQQSLPEDLSFLWKW